MKENIFNYFDEVKIINLTFRKDRRDETIQEFERYGFPIHAEKVNFMDAVSPSSANGFPSPGVRGCYLSHLKIIENAHRLQLKNVLILEDDISFSKRIVEYGAVAIQSLKDIDWDIVYFGHPLSGDLTEVCWQEVKQPVMLTHFYAINSSIFEDFSRFLKLILERPPGHPDGGPMHYDAAINTYRKCNPNIKVYCFSKNLGYQRASKSDLSEVSCLDSNFILKPIVQCVRKVKRAYKKIKY